jgi:hypothetical protein
MSNASALDRAAGLLDAAGRDPDGVLPPSAATRSLQAASELHRAGARPVLHGGPLPPVAAICEALRLKPGPRAGAVDLRANDWRC